MTTRQIASEKRVPYTKIFEEKANVVMYIIPIDLACSIFFSMIPLIGIAVLFFNADFFSAGFNWKLSRPSKRIAKPQPVQEFKFWWKEPWR